MVTKYDYNETNDWDWSCDWCGNTTWLSSHLGEFIRCEECLRCVCEDEECGE